MRDRVRRMEERLRTAKYPLCIDRIRASFPVLEEMKGQHIYTIRSCVHEAILTKTPVVIEPDDLICGVGAGKPYGIELDYEFGEWTPDEVTALKSENYTISPEDEEQLYKYMERFKEGNLGKTAYNALGEILTDDPKAWAFMKTGILPPAWKSKVRGPGGGRAQSGIGLQPLGLFVADYDTWLNKGCRYIIDIAKEKLAQHTYFAESCVEKKLFWQGVVRVFEAIVVWANRYAALADKLAEEEKNAVRAAELRQMAEVCRRVPEYPATNFREAIQSHWFAFMLSNPSSTASFGRMDQLLYPFYKRDKEAGLITDEDVLELFEIIRLKDLQLNRVSGATNRKQNAGMAKWHNVTLGGVDNKGDNAVNELTYLFFEAAKEIRTPHHTMTLRVNEVTPLEAIAKALEVVRLGIGMPAFISDKSYINFYINHGFSLEEAREYCIAGCIDPIIPGRTRNFYTAMFALPIVYDIFIHNGWFNNTKEMVGIETGDVTKMATFDDYKEGFYRQMRYFLSRAVQQLNVQVELESGLLPDFFRSAQIRECLETGTEYLKIHQKPYDALIAISAVGAINVADSFAVVKTLVYDQKKYSMQQLMDALDANWVGYEELYRDCLDVPKYGNDDPLPDLLAAEIYSKFAEAVVSLDTVRGGKAIPTGISISAHQPAGMAIGATPDGRRKGEICADASISPGQGRDENGPVAMLKSAMKINQDLYQATLLNMKFHPSALEIEKDLMKLAILIKTYLTNGGKQIQFNVVDQETLEKAQKNPESHRDLVVRVAGYSAYFTLLTPMIQNEVIARTSNIKV